MNIVLVCNSRAEEGPLESVMAALPEAAIARYDAAGMSPATAMSQALLYFTAVYQNAKPRLVIVLGDRYETLAASLAAFFLRIPIAHIHGGETTAGAFDDALRHSIAHLAALHFVPTWEAMNKIRDLKGVRCLPEEHKIYIVGAPGLDGIPQNSAQRDRKLVLVTFHPETMAPDYGLASCRAMLTALGCTQLLGHETIFCGVNSDPGSAEITTAIKDHLRNHGGTYMPDASHASYIGMMQHAALVIGNSSAGIIEAPWIGCPTVNIGMRQSGRPQAASIFNSHADADDIRDSIKRALAFSGDPRPQYTGGAAPKIASIVREFVNQK